MAGITLEQAEAQLASWLAASTAVAAGQSYEIAGRKLTRADAEQVKEMISYWDGKVKQLDLRTRGRSRARTIVAAG